MISKTIAAVTVGAVLLAGGAVAVYGIPARGLVDTFSRDVLARHDLVLDIGGDARLTIWPETGLTLGDVRLRDSKTTDEIARIDGVRAAIGLGNLWNGKVDIADLTLTRPVVRTDPMFARAARGAAARKSRSLGAGGTNESILPVDQAVAIGRVAIDDGLIVLRDGSQTAEVKLESLRLASLPAAGGRSNLHLDAKIGAANLRVTAPGDTPTRLADGKAVPIEARIDAPNLFRTPATISTTLTSAGPVLKADNLNGLVDQGRLRGAVSVSFAGARPFVDATLESERLDLTSLVEAVTGPTPPTRPGSTAAPAPWSDAPLDLFGLGLVDANIALDAREVAIEGIRIAPAVIEASLLADTLKVELSPSGVYGGQATGEITIDRTGTTPAVSVKTSFSGLDALPFLRDAVAFEYIEGKARGSLEVRGTGRSPREIVGSLTGRGDLLFENGAVRGIDMPAMLRSVLDAILAGWQAGSGEQTRFSTFKGTFTVASGVARTTDVAFQGPYMVMSAAGNIDLRAKTLDLRADPRLVAAPTTPGQAGNVLGIGVPVAIQGPWSAPRIYADTPNVLANPDGALKALRDALGPGGGAQIGKLIDGLKGLAPGPTPGVTAPGVTPPSLAPPGGEPPREPSTLADDIMKALKGAAPPSLPPSLPAPAPAPRDLTTPRPAVPPVTATAPPPPPTPEVGPVPRTTPPPTRETRPKPPPEPTVRELEEGAREFLKGFFGR
ncbi:AsmA-like C-terminal region-containing protein [Rhodoplanes sp. SY1]|uniref:AsmA family protein n=1 Tax=Rhodoplanes sp. SY1 TaxID=3166646 RepID=UPI0038B553EE